MSIDFYLPEMIAYAASCMSLFRHCGIRQTRPFAIICNGISQQDELADHLKIFTDNRIHSLKSFAAHPLQFINAAKDDILFLQYAQDSQAGYLPAEETDFFSVIVPVREVEKVLGTRLNGRRIQQKLADQKTDLHMLWEALNRKAYREYMCEFSGDDEEILYAAAAVADIQKDMDSQQKRILQSGLMLFLNQQT